MSGISYLPHFCKYKIIIGQLFAECPLDSYPNPAIEPVVDSSRYFVVRIQEDTGRSAFIGQFRINK